MPSEKILISGAGIAGLALARQLKKLNIPFKVIEKRPQLFTESAGIALPANAVQALRYMGLGEKIDQSAHQVNKIIYTDSMGEVLSEASLLEPPLNADQFVALDRSALHEMLCDGLDEDIQFDTTIDEIFPTHDGVLVKFNNKPQSEKFSALVGADGIHSQVRQFIFPDNALVDLGVTVWRWTCQYPSHDLQPTYMFGALDVFMAYPISKNAVYCYAHVFDPENIHAKSNDHKNALAQVFKQYGSIAKTMLKILPDNQSIIPGRLRSVPQALFASGCVALIGDAGHACSPMLQQGAAAALEDVIVLSELLKKFPVEDAFFHYEKFRSERVNWIVSASDAPMKMLINMNPQALSAIQQKIREGGPLNVQGWKKLLANSPTQEIASYVETQC